jgi:hypothetical protein
MVIVRRWYIFLVNAVSLQAVTWAIIALLRNGLATGFNGPVEATAFQIAVIVIGLPVFLVHWLWTQRLAEQEPDERQSALRRLYLYGTQAAFLGPFAANAFSLVATLLRLLWGVSSPRSFNLLSPTEAMIHALVALVILGLFWFYHQRIIAADTQAVPETDHAATVRRLTIFGFSAAGLAMASLGLIHLARWLIFQIGPEAIIGGAGENILAAEIARLVVGMPLWLIFWLWAQRLFTGPKAEERASVLRKVYLYVTVLIAVLSFVGNTAIILAGFLRSLLDLPSVGDIRDPLPIVLGAAVLWAYHAFVLQSDAALAGKVSRQAGVRRLYLYLVAAIGLAAFLIGLSGDVSVLIRALSGASFGSDLKEQVAWFSAALIVGLPVWLWPWRQVEREAVASNAVGIEERRSIVRKIYLYFYLFVATMTVLGNVVYIVFQLLNLALDGRTSAHLVSDLGQAIAFSLIAVGAWLYHGMILRDDGQLYRRDQAARLAEWQIAVVDADEGDFGRATLEHLRRELPDLTLNPIGLTERAAQAMGMEIPADSIAAQLASAGLIIGPWDITVVGGRGGAVTVEIAQAVVTSSACKLLAPVRAEGWEWAGVERRNTEGIVHQTVHAVKQIASGEDVEPARPLGLGTIIGLIIGALFLLGLLAVPILLFFSGF